MLCVSSISVNGGTAYALMRSCLHLRSTHNSFPWVAASPASCFTVSSRFLTGITVLKRMPDTIGCASTSRRYGAYGGIVTIAFTTVFTSKSKNASVSCWRSAVPWRQQLAERSEERRVGKESRSRWSPYHLKNNNYFCL